MNKSEPTYFHWRGVDLFNQPKHGRLSAQNKEELRQQLHQKGIILRRVTPASLFSRRIRTTHIIMWCKELAMMLDSKISLPQALILLSQNHTNETLSRVTQSLKTSMTQGLDFANALRLHPKLFSPLFCHVIAAGEASGTLAQVLHHWHQDEDKKHRAKQHLKTIMIYPVMTLILAMLVVFGLMFSVIPAFSALYTEFNTPLPGYTQCLIHFSAIIKSYGLVLLSSFGLLSYGVYQLLALNRTLKRYAHQLQLKIPILGSLLSHFILARATRLLSLMMKAHMPLLDALNVLSHAEDHHHYATSFKNIAASMSQGLAFHVAMNHEPLFPAQMVHMIRIGEESATLDEMLALLAYHEEHAWTDQMGVLEQWLGPVVMIFLGLLMAGLILALYLPIIQMGALF